MGDSDKRPAILLSEGSSTSARQTLYGLGRRYRIDILDPSRWCQCRFSSLVRRWHRCPPIAKDPFAYIEYLQELLNKEHFDVLFPTHEQVYLICKYRDLIGDKVGLAVPEFESLQRLQSKAEFFRLCDQQNFPTPHTCIARTQRELEACQFFPCYVKLVHSTASHGVRFVNNLTELREALQLFKNEGAWTEGEEILLQRPAHGCQSVASAVFQNGTFIAAHCTEILETGIGGGPVLRVSANHESVIEDLRRLGRYLNWHGPLMLDYFFDKSLNQPQYIEANPRIGETENAVLCGVNLCEIVVQISLGQQLEEFAPGRTGIKSHAGFITLLAQAYNGANRRQLIQQLYQHWTRQGIYEFESELTRPREDWGSLIPAMAVAVRLLAFPQSARRLSKKTVQNYALPQSAVTRLHD